MPQAAKDYAAQVPTFTGFQLPKDFGAKPAPAPEPEVKEPPAAPPAEAKPTEPAPVTEGAEPEQAEPLTTAKEPEKPEGKETGTPRRLQNRIDRATKRAAEAEARAEAAAREIEQLKANQAPQPDPQAPKMADFTDIEQYAKAHAEYAVKKETEARERKQREEQQATSLRELTSQWAEHAIKGEDKYDDFHEVVGELKPTAPWAIAIMKSENAPDVAYYMGKHIKETQKIIALDPISQVFAVAQIAHKLAQTPAPPKQASKAPAPIAPVGATSATAEPALTDKMSPEQYMKIGSKFFRGRS